MNADRPMNEYESALYEAIRILGQAVVEMGANRGALQARFEDMQEQMERDGQKNGAATLQLLCGSILNPGTKYMAAPPN